MSDIESLKAQIAALKAQQTTKGSPLTVKVGDKGTINVYGLGRFPVCLYLTQINRITELFNSDSFKQFVATNAQLIEANAEYSKKVKLEAKLAELKG